MKVIEFLEISEVCFLLILFPRNESQEIASVVRMDPNNNCQFFFPPRTIKGEFTQLV